MASTYTSALRIERPGQGDYLNNWAAIIDQIFDVIDEGVTGLATITTTGGTTTLSTNNGTSDEARRAAVKVQGVLASNAIIVVPDLHKPYLFVNATTGAFTVAVKASGSASSILIPQGKAAVILADGASNVIFTGPPTALSTGAIDSSALPIGSSAAPGIVQVATDVVAAAGTDTSVVVTAKQLGDAKAAAISGANDATARATANAALPKAGGTMTGAVAMGGNKVSGLAAATVAGDAVRFEQLPTVAVASGAAHAGGLVPDPGVTAGTTKFLREDMTFAVPTGGAATTDASMLTSGTLAAARLPATGISASSISSGTLPAAQLPATGISASSLSSGTLPAAQLPAFGGGDVSFAAAGGAGTIAANAVSNAKAAQMPATTLKGNNAGAAANQADLTMAQVTAMLNAFTSALQGLVPASGGGTVNFLRADGTFAAPTVTFGTGSAV